MTLHQIGYKRRQAVQTLYVSRTTLFDSSLDWGLRSFGNQISWSACKDGETSVDTFKNGIAVGAMSNVSAINSHYIDSSSQYA